MEFSKKKLTVKVTGALVGYFNTTHFLEQVLSRIFQVHGAQTFTGATVILLQE